MEPNAKRNLEDAIMVAYNLVLDQVEVNGNKSNLERDARIIDHLTKALSELAK